MLWLLAALLFQVGVYEYLDRVILTPAARFSQQAVGGEVKSGESVYYSHDNAFYARVSDRGVKVFSTVDNHQVKEISLQEKESITYFSWLPERNLALAGIGLDDYKGTTVTLKSINPETNSEPVAPKISGLSKGAKIVSVAYSTQTNVINMLVKNGNDMAVYRTDANNNLKKVNVNTTGIRRIASLRSQDALLYDSVEKGKVYSIDANGRRTELSPPNGRFALIGVDKGDNIYIGKLNDGKLVTSILAGKVHGGFKEVKNLDSSYPADSITVTYDGKVLFS